MIGHSLHCSRLCKPQSISVANSRRTGESSKNCNLAGRLWKRLMATTGSAACPSDAPSRIAAAQVKKAIQRKCGKCRPTMVVVRVVGMGRTRKCEHYALSRHVRAWGRHLIRVPRRLCSGRLHLHCIYESRTVQYLCGYFGQWTLVPFYFFDIIFSRSSSVLPAGLPRHRMTCPEAPWDAFHCQSLFSGSAVSGQHVGEYVGFGRVAATVSHANATVTATAYRASGIRLHGCRQCASG
jgi:hypothetical protein